MEVHKVYWWEHNSKLGQYSSAKVHRSLEINHKVEEPKSIDGYEIKLHELDGLKVEVIDGL
jgi:CRISPR-associated protein Csd2